VFVAIEIHLVEILTNYNLHCLVFDAVSNSQWNLCGHKSYDSRQH